MLATRRISLRVNGSRVHGRCRGASTRIGCEHGAFGACTILLDGVAVRSCLLFALQAHGAEITTVEGRAQEDGALHLLQAAFRKHRGLQRGFCTPGCR